MVWNLEKVDSLIDWAVGEGDTELYEALLREKKRLEGIVSPSCISANMLPYLAVSRLVCSLQLLYCRCCGELAGLTEIRWLWQGDYLKSRARGFCVGLAGCWGFFDVLA